MKGLLIVIAASLVVSTAFAGTGAVPQKITTTQKSTIVAPLKTSVTPYQTPYRAVTAPTPTPAVPVPPLLDRADCESLPRIPDGTDLMIYRAELFEVQLPQVPGLGFIDSFINVNATPDPGNLNKSVHVALKPLADRSYSATFCVGIVFSGTEGIMTFHFLPNKGTAAYDNLLRTGFKLVVDPGNEISEHDESNNEFTCTSLTRVCDDYTSLEGRHHNIQRPGYDGPCYVWSEDACTH